MSPPELQSSRAGSRRPSRRVARRPWAAGVVLLALLGAGALWLLADQPPRLSAEARRLVEGASPAALPDLPEPPRAAPGAPRVLVVDAAPDALTDGASDSALVRIDTPQPAELSGRVLDQDGRGVAGVVVRLYRGQEHVEARTDAYGAYLFEDLRTGLYRLFVDPRALPEGYLPPPREAVARGADAAEAFSAARRLVAGARQTADLRVYATAQASGRVVRADGAPVGDALVTLTDVAGRSELARTLADGTWRLPSVRAGNYVAAVQAGGAAPLDDGESPLPLDVVLPAGRAVVVPDLVAGQGGHVLTGTVVDAAGAPVAGLTVCCRAADAAPGEPPLASAVTDAAGRYRVGRVPSAALLVGVEADGGRPGTALVAGASEPLRVDTRGGPALRELGTLEVDALRPFRLLGRVRVDPDWAAAHGFSRWNARVLVAPTAPEAPVAGETEPAMASGGRFQWSCATPHPEVQVTVLVRGNEGGEVERTERVRPVPDGTGELLVSIP